MNVIMISTDRSIFTPGSEAWLRMREYGNLFTSLHIIVFTPRGFSELRISETTRVYPTNSWVKLLAPWQAYRIARGIMRGNKKYEIRNKEEEKWVVTTQDPFETGLVGRLLALRTGIRWQAQIHTDFLSPWFCRQFLLNKI